MDSLYIEAIIIELRERLAGACISKIHQPSAESLVFKFWTGRESLRMLVSVASGRSRLHLTRHAYPNPPAPARFCQLLRARLSRLLTLEQVPGERVVRLTFSAADSDRNTSVGEARLILLAELTSRNGNLVLLDEQGRIIDALKRFDGGEGRRAVLPGKDYQGLPSLSGQVLLEENLVVPEQIRSADAFERWLLREIRPMSRMVARDMALQVEQGGQPERVLESFRQARQQREYHFLTAMVEGRAELSAFVPKVLKTEQAAIFPAPSLAADAYYGKPATRSDGMDERRLLQSAIRRSLKRLGARKSRIEAEQAAAAGAEQQRQFGELLLAHLYLLKPGMVSVVLENYYADPPTPVTIPLEPRLTPQENAQRYFHRYKKLKRSREHVVRRLEETEEERLWLEEMALAHEEAENAEDLAAIRRELVDAGLLQSPPRSAGPKTGSDPGRRVRETISPGGYRLYWGTGNRVNDHVSRHLCKADDLWFHALDLPGCHLVLKKEGGGDVPESDQLFAASLAAGYSRGKNEGKVAVMVTEGKWVQKPKGARPGLVTVKRFRTFLVEPRRMN